LIKIKKQIEKEIEKTVQIPFILGASDLTGFVPQRCAHLNFGITIGLKLNDNIVDRVENGPTESYIKHYYEINSLLKEISRKVERMIKERGKDAQSINPTVSGDSLQYLNNLAGEFPHKLAATKSGLGWIGKSDLFISDRFGPRLRLITVFTDMELETGVPAEVSKCGNCTVCVEHCPAQAISGKNWKSGMKREEFFNAYECRKTGTKLTLGNTGVDDCICGICVSVCPIGKKEIKKDCS